MEWDSVGDGYYEPATIDGLRFDVEAIDDREPTREEAERLDEELIARMDTDPAFGAMIGVHVNEWQEDRGMDW